MRDSEYGTDHMLIHGKLKLSFMHGGGSEGIKTHKYSAELKLRALKVKTHLRNGIVEAILMDLGLNLRSLPIMLELRFLVSQTENIGIGFM